MSRNLRLSWLVLLLLGGLACAGVDDSIVVDAAVDAKGGSPDVRDPTWCIEPINTLPQPQPADVLILFDRSGSMDTALMDTTLGSVTRYQRALTVLSDLVNSYAFFVRFGYEELPGRQNCPTPDIGCCVSDPSIDPAFNNAPTIVAAMAAAAPMQGSTPAAGALGNALDYFSRLEDGVANRYVFLATHGMPGCDFAGHLQRADTVDASGTSTAGPCFDALAQVHLLVSAGIQVMVLDIDDSNGANSAGSGSCLDALAVAGGFGTSRFVAAEMQPLYHAMGQIFGGTDILPSCQLELERQPISSRSVQVYLDGQPVATKLALQQDGSSVVSFQDADCTQLQNFQRTRIEISGCFDCPEGTCGTPDD